MKKIISIVLALAFVFGMGVTAIAAETDITEAETGYTGEAASIITDETAEPETVDVPEIITEEVPEEEAAVEAASAEEEEEEVTPAYVEPVNYNSYNAVQPVSDKIVRMYLCATAGSVCGHVWLYFINLTDRELPLGYATLLPYEEMSVGSLRNTRTDGGGTYYNGEAYMAKGRGNVINNTISLCMDLTEAQLKTVSDKIKSKNSYNVIINNCGNFATSVWNSVSSKKVIAITFPIITIAVMAMHGGKFGAVSMKTPNISRCFKQSGKGVKQAQASSFNLSCVG